MIKFGLSQLKDKKRIIIWNDRDNYKKHIEHILNLKIICALIQMMVI